MGCTCGTAVRATGFAPVSTAQFGTLERSVCHSKVRTNILHHAHSWVVNSASKILEVRGPTIADPCSFTGALLSSYFYPDLCDLLIPAMLLGEVHCCCLWWFDLRHVAVVTASAMPDRPGCVIFEQHHPSDLTVPFEHPQTPPSHIDLLCAACRRFQANDEWLSPEDFYVWRLRQGSLQVQHLSHTVCDDCLKRKDTPTLQRLWGETVDLTAGSRDFRAKAVMVIVDDDPISIRLTERHATKAGFKPICFMDPIAALAYISSHTVHILITDVVMPQITGIQLHSVLWQRGIRCVTIAMSGCENYKRKCLDVGMDAFLTKPVSKTEFNEAVEILTPNRLGDPFLSFPMSE